MKVLISLLSVLSLSTLSLSTLLLMAEVDDAGASEPVEQEAQAVASSESESRDCTVIVSAVKRLACFDERNGTPPLPVTRREPTEDHGTTPSIPVLPIVGMVRDNEAARSAEDEARFRIMEVHDSALDQQQVVISAPALGVSEQRPYLAISCLSNITRLQLLVEQPIEHNQVRMRLVLDDRPLTESKIAWRVLEVGNVVDAGRGLVAIDQLKRLGEGGHLRLESDYIPFDGLVFDATGLKDLVDRQREACHW